MKTLAVIGMIFAFPAMSMAQDSCLVIGDAAYLAMKMRQNGLGIDDVTTIVAASAYDESNGPEYWDEMSYAIHETVQEAFAVPVFENPEQVALVLQTFAQAKYDACMG